MTNPKRTLLIITVLTAAALTSGCICLNFTENLNSIKSAMTNKDASRCERMQDQLKNACYTSVAISTKDVNVCAYIQDEDMTVGCYISVAAENEAPELCQKIKNTDLKYSCITQTAIRMKNQKVCRGILDQNRKDECLLRARL